jgi:hypothetical protein
MIEVTSNRPAPQTTLRTISLSVLLERFSPETTALKCVVERSFTSQVLSQELGLGKGPLDGPIPLRQLMRLLDLHSHLESGFAGYFRGPRMFASLQDKDT